MTERAGAKQMTSTRKIDLLGIIHLEQYHLSHDPITDRQKMAKEKALEIVQLDARAERYIRRYLYKRNELWKKMRYGKVKKEGVIE